MFGVKNILKKQATVFKSLPQLLVLFSASLTSIGAGAIYTFTSPAIPKLLTDEYKFTIEQVSYLPVIPPLTMVLTAMPFCKLADKIGRKYTLLSSGIIHLVCWLLTALTKNIWTFYLSRVLFGFAEASVYAAMPAYVAEITTPTIRSILGNIMTMSAYAGQLLINCVGFYWSIELTSFVMLSLPIFFMITYVFVPESPYYLLMIGDKAAAEKSLQKLRRSRDVSEELRQLNHDVDRQLSESGNFKDLWQIKSNRKALAIGILSRVFQQFSGASAINVYTQHFFQQMGGNISSGTSAMIIAAEIAIMSIIGNVICDKIGKRKSMIISAFGCGTALLLEALYFFLHSYEIVDLSAISSFPLVGIISFVIMYGVGLGIVPSIIPGEMFSTSIKKHATACTTIIYGLVMCGNMKLFEFLMTSYGLWILFSLYSVFCFISCFMSWLIIPETKGKTLEEIQQMLKGNS